MLKTLKAKRLQEEQFRDKYETQRVQSRQLDDWQRADQAEIAKKQQYRMIAEENKRLAETKRLNKMTERINTDVREETAVKSYFQTVQSLTIR